MPGSILHRPPDHLDLPDPLGRLVDLAYNLWWTWHRPARQLFERIHPPRWARYRNPVAQLMMSRQRHLWTLAEDADFLTDMEEVLAEFDADMARPGLDGPPVAYVSAEYGLHESLPVYSGGLGVLSGDHLKEASDMGLPLVGVGLFYRRGYFRQLIDADGHQQHHYPDLDALRLPLLRVKNAQGGTLRVPVELGNRIVHLRVWVTYVGRIPLLLLDSMTTRNADEDRYITSLLYVMGRDMRLEQEIILGRGAIAVLEALEIDPKVWHMNEGHSAFLAVQNMRRSGIQGIQPAVEACRGGHVFTTHTPVPAGNEVFKRDKVRPFLTSTAADLGCDVEELLDLGNPDGERTADFNLTALALRLSTKANGVSQLHGQISQAMWPQHEIGAITNGIHVGSWLGREMSTVLSARGGDDPRLLADRCRALPDESLWAAHTAQKHRLMRFVRVRNARQIARHGGSTADLRRIQALLNPNALTLGFARRFAPYKRADLLFSDPARLERLFCNAERPVQLIMAGKAHPADRAGQAIIQRIWHLAGSRQLHGRIVFVEDYDMAVARLLVRGVDLWLNTPEWPREASGTSGMKAGINGVLNASVPDGWWAEVDDPDMGYTIGTQQPPDAERDGLLLLDLLEQQIVPAYYDRGDDGLPRRWIGMMRQSAACVLERFSTRRMLQDYAREMYDLGIEQPADA
jgi:starch phosphorylase